MRAKDRSLRTWAERNRPLWKKISITIGLLIVFRLGSIVPAPGVAGTASAGDGLSTAALLNLFTGGAMARMAIFALGVMPYITAAIIMQLASVFIPWVERQRKDNGQEGVEKITQVTRYLTLVLAAAESGVIVWTTSRGYNTVSTATLSDNITLFGYIAIALILTAGSIITMRIGEIITEKGVGNGMSLLIFTSIAALVPQQIVSAVEFNSKTHAAIIFAGLAILLILVVWVEGAIRKIPVRYARRQVGNRVFGSGGTYIPLRINQASVVPVIFSSSIIMLPAVITGMVQPDLDPNHWWFEKVVEPLTTPTSAAYIISTIVLVVFFAYFYVSVQNDPDEQAERLAKANGFIPGYRVGDQTARYLWAVMSRLLVVGSFYLAFIATIPNIVMHYSTGGEDGSSASIPFAGTSLLILVSVALNTVQSLRGESVKTSFVESVLKPVGMSRGDKKIAQRLFDTKENVPREGENEAAAVSGSTVVAIDCKEGEK